MTFRIESSSGLPITRQLVDQITMACASGEGWLASVKPVTGALLLWIKILGMVSVL